MMLNAADNVYLIREKILSKLSTALLDQVEQSKWSLVGTEEMRFPSSSGPDKTAAPIAMC